MAKQVQRLILLAVALAAMVCLAVWLMIEPAQETSSQPEMSAQSPLPDSTVRCVNVQNRHGSYVISCTEVEGLPTEQIETASLEALFDGLNMLVLEKLEDAAVKDAVYGLQQPVAEAKLFYETGESLTIYIGVKEEISKRYYCSANENKDVYLMNGVIAERLLMDAQSYLSLQVTPVCLASSPLNAIGDICFSNGETEIRIRTAEGADEDFKRELLSFGAVTHVVEGPGILHELNRTYAQEIFTSLLGLYAEDVVAYGLTDTEMLEQGFAAPTMTVRFGLRNGDSPNTPVQPYTLRLLKQENGAWWAAVNGRGIIYQISSAAFMEVEYADFVNRWFLSPLLADLKALRIAIPQAEYLYEINGTTPDLQVVKRGRQISLERFRSFYTLAVSAASNGDYLGLVHMDGEPIFTVEFIYRDTAKPSDVMEMYPLDERRYAVAVNGVTEFTIRKNYVSVLTEAINALEIDAEIPQTW